MKRLLKTTACLVLIAVLSFALSAAAAYSVFVPTNAPTVWNWFHSLPQLIAATEGPGIMPSWLVFVGITFFFWFPFIATLILLIMLARSTPELIEDAYAA